MESDMKRIAPKLFTLKGALEPAMEELGAIEEEYCVYSGFCPDIADSAVYILADTATIYTLVWLEEIELERETTH
jgi:hypothetical protein